MKLFNLLILSLLTFSSFAQDDLTLWFHEDPSSGRYGVAADKAHSELTNKTGQPIIVAIIDSGVDIEHEDLKDVIWINPGEIPGNGIDDDRNGYVDDVNGWNFIGGPGGKNVGPDTYEVTRLYGKYKYKFENADPNLLNKKDKELYSEFVKWEEEVTTNRSQAESALQEMKQIETTVMSAIDAVELALGDKEFTLDNISAIESDEQLIMIGKRISNDFMSGGDITSVDEAKEALKEALGSDAKRQQDRLDYAYNPDFDPRSTIVKDNYSDATQKNYGNNDVEGPDALHGTHVAGIVAAMRDNDLGAKGIANNVKIMSVRTVPDGDERDKDVANAIRYAVDNGASIINMSFGKGYSWNKGVVDDAVKYATKKDVLLVHAAGNSALNIDKEANFPHDKYDKASGFLFWKKKKSKAWIEVGALTPGSGDAIVAPFSNYGKDNVDIFAPGVQIYSPVPDDKYRYLQGTSMASPAVAGVAAVIRSYFPTLKAEQVKEILMQSATPINQVVTRPGDKEKVNFSTLSVQGGAVNLYNAVKMAEQTKGKKKIKNKSNA